MSSEENSEGHSSTTTVSSVAVQAGDSRIVIAVLKCGQWVQLQLVESNPNLLEIGSSQDETKKLLQDHELLLAKLKALEGQVWDLLQEADKAAEENSSQGRVYDAMAETLGEAWAALVTVLEKRRALLKLTAEFFENALEFAMKIDQAEDFLQNAQEFESTESLKSILQLHEHHTKGLLERSLALLNKSQQLTDYIEEFKSEGSNVTSELTQGAHCSCLKIDSLLELLQDRRRQLDKYLKSQGQELEQVLQICQWDQQESQVTCWFQNNIEGLQKQSLGSSLSENEELIRKHNELLFEAKEWNSVVEKLKGEALRILLSENYVEKEHFQLSNQKLSVLQEEFDRLMEGRKTLLHEANGFFNSVNKAFDELGRVEAYLKVLKSEGLSLPALAMKQEKLHSKMRDCTVDALQKGQVLISQGGADSSQMAGIQKMMGCIERRVDQLTQQCSAYKEFALKRQQFTASVEGYLQKASVLIQKITPELSNGVDVGSSLTESERILSKYQELDSQAKETTCELEAAVRAMKEKDELEPVEVDSLSGKADLLLRDLKILGRNIGSKLQILQIYVSFLKSSQEVEAQAQILKGFYQTKIAQSEDEEAKPKALVESSDREWQLFFKKSFSAQDLGCDCLDLINMANENLLLKAKNIIHLTENTLENLRQERERLTHLWLSWQLHVNHTKPVKQQCGAFKEHFKKTTHSLKLLQEVIMPVLALDLGSNLQTLLELQKKCKHLKPQVQQLHAEVQYAVKASELLHLKGIPGKEKSEKLKEMTQLYQKVEEKMKNYETILNKTVQFHHAKEELENLIRLSELEFSEPFGESEDVYNAKAHLSRSQERQSHIRHLYQLALTLGMEIISEVQRPNCSNVSAKTLQQQLEKLESDRLNWHSKADKYEEKLSHNFQYCTTREEINELRESFKDIKKKFNNLKFNYSKKTEKARNMKVLKNHIQQVDMYVEKMQALKKKMENITSKISNSLVRCSKVCILLESVNELQKQVGEFGRGVEEYKKNLDMTEQLQEMMEECQFWYDEASATVVRVGKYSVECKTQEAVEILSKQFSKFITPTVPQQEERIQEITDLAQRLYGIEDGQKYVEKIKAKHKEVLESVTELCRSLTELGEKLKEPKKVADIPGVGEGLLSLDVDLSSSAQEESIHTLPLSEETPSGEEYECISPDDVSLPPLPTSPESNPMQGEGEIEGSPSSNPHSLHVCSSSLQMQINAGSQTARNEPNLSIPAASAYPSDGGRETVSTQFERLPCLAAEHFPKFKAGCHFTSLELLETSSASGAIKAKPSASMMSEVHETYTQRCHQVHTSMSETQERLHDNNNSTKTQDRPHASPRAFPGLGFRADPTRSHQNQMVSPGEIKSASEKNSLVSLSGRAPNFSKTLSNATVTEGSPVTLEVEVTGFPEPTLTWYKKGQKLSSDGHLKVLRKETKHTVFIQEVCETDAGLYVARAQNSSGTLSSSAILRVTVQRKLPGFLERFGPANLQEGDDLLLHCTVSGRPRPKVIWSKDGVRVIAGDFNIQKLGDAYYLFKKNVVLADTGEYVCSASNEVGEAFCSANIVVTGEKRTTYRELMISFTT
ncbi:coiled-coil domain-containing protein 141 [Tachyglossus aculeatus]|uniref:coiled-coil domain-containing protein 141 n=1 Tax=Tachyglossus aculeatus TaxID=9261 RepID=UPI0018F624AD|nr:coiled-coil domain-containing protein 141 [Tachyglossus aculeatus]